MSRCTNSCQLLSKYSVNCHTLLLVDTTYDLLQLQCFKLSPYKPYYFHYTMLGEATFISIDSSPSFLLSVLSALLASICEAPVDRASMNVFESLNRMVESCIEVEL